MSTLSTQFAIDPWSLHEAGAFDVPLDGTDAHVYLDPRLLRRSKQPEFQGALEDIARHYAAILQKIAASAKYSQDMRARVLAAAEADFHAPELDGLHIEIMSQPRVAPAFGGRLQPHAMGRLS